MGARRPEAGTAIVGTIVGFLILMVLLLFATQLIVRLYAESTLTSAATRAAESVATAPSPALEVAAAEAAARGQLGTFGSSHVSFVWEEVDAQQVVLLVRAQSPEFLPGLSAWSRIERTVTIRTERFR
ncbi:MAG: hypothetical protein KGQ66_22660 [Acidobacteriota bacterium]|nr:hypothetical protein [Acidobacteriota bacterium]